MQVSNFVILVFLYKNIQIVLKWLRKAKVIANRLFWNVQSIKQLECQGLLGTLPRKIRKILLQD